VWGGSLGSASTMNWEQRYRLRHYLRVSLAFYPTVALVAALVCAPAVRGLDEATGWALLRFSPDGARALLGALTASMLTFMVFVLSSLLIVVQLAGGQLTPRIIAFVFATPRVRVTLSVFAFTFAYTLSALARVEDRVPHLHVGLAVLLNLVCVVAFFRFVEQLATGLRPAALVRDIADRGVEVIREVYPCEYDETRPEVAEALLPDSPRAAVVESTGSSGVVMAVGVAELVRLARDADAVIEVVPQVGDFVAKGDPLFRVDGGPGPAAAALESCVAIGAERTLEQDPRFAFRILVDIAIKALSPAINDPTTGVLAIDQLHRLLLFLGRRHLDDGRLRDRDGKLRVAYGTPDWPNYVVLAVSEIRHYGGSSLQVTRRLRAMLEHLTGALPEARHDALAEELQLLARAAERGFLDEQDRKRAGIGDYQGVGGSDMARPRGASRTVAGGVN
jgi:uncharacterized membrane protein